MKTNFMLATLVLLSGSSAFAYNDVITQKTLIAVGNCTAKTVLGIKISHPAYFIPLTYEVTKARATQEAVQDFSAAMDSMIHDPKFTGFEAPKKSKMKETLQFMVSDTAAEQCELAQTQLKALLP